MGIPGNRDGGNVASNIYCKVEEVTKAPLINGVAKESEIVNERFGTSDGATTGVLYRRLGLE